MFILSIQDQQKVIAQYEKDYGHLVLAYNRYANDHNKVLAIHNAALALRDEIKHSSNFYRKFFNEENSNYTKILVEEIDRFIDKYLSNNDAYGQILFYTKMAKIA